MIMEIETYWAEIKIDKQPNRLVGVVYKHPTRKNNEKCLEHLNETLMKIHRENNKSSSCWRFQLRSSPT